jgi:Saxitoxin biosynthesis operon protein SxtJ
MSHEDLQREQVVEGSTDRMFGLVFAAVFAVVAAWPLISGQAPRWWAAAVAAAFAVAALLKPLLLAAPNRLWTRFGVMLGKVVSPIALGVLFYGVISPLGIALRLVGKDPLRLKRDAASASYWIKRDPPGPPPTSMTQQF